MTTAPRIVVGCGVYNEADYLEETIPAILTQTMPEFALLVLDNGSTDQSWPILQDLIASDPRVTLMRSPTNLWPPHAANRCWRYAMERWPDCRWFLGQGADDVMAPEYLEAILEAAAENPTRNMIFAPRKWIGRDEVKPWPRYDPETIHAEPQISGWRAFTRELWEKVGPEDVSIRIGADWEWAVRASVLGVLRPYQLDQPLLALRVRPASRRSQSSEVDWPALHHRLCAVAGKPAPAWAKERALC